MKVQEFVSWMRKDSWDRLINKTPPALRFVEDGFTGSNISLQYEGTLFGDRYLVHVVQCYPHSWHKNVEFEPIPSAPIDVLRAVFQINTVGFDVGEDDLLELCGTDQQRSNLRKWAEEVKCAL